MYWSVMWKQYTFSRVLFRKLLGIHEQVGSSIQICINKNVDENRNPKKSDAFNLDFRGRKRLIIFHTWNSWFFFGLLNTKSVLDNRPNTLVFCQN